MIHAGDAAELFDVEVDQLTRVLALIAADRLGWLQRSQPAQAEPAQDAATVARDHALCAEAVAHLATVFGVMLNWRAAAALLSPASTTPRTREKLTSSGRRVRRAGMLPLSERPGHGHNCRELDPVQSK